MTVDSPTKSSCHPIIHRKTVVIVDLSNSSPCSRPSPSLSSIVISPIIHPHQCEYWRVLGCCMYWYVWWYVLWNVLVSTDMVCVMACIGMYYFWCILHVLISIGMYSKVICASIHMYGKNRYVFICTGIY